MLRRNGKEVRVRLYTDEPTVAQARAQVQACLDKARAVNDAITVEVPRPHPFAYIYESKLHGACPGEAKTLLRPRMELTTASQPRL